MKDYGLLRRQDTLSVYVLLIELMVLADWKI